MTLEEKVKVIVEKVDRIDENVEHLSNGGLKSKLQEQNEFLTEQFTTVVNTMLSNQQQIELEELKKESETTKSKYNFKNNKLMYSFLGAAIVKLLDLLPQIIQYLT